MACKLGVLLFVMMCASVANSAEDDVKNPSDFCQKSASGTSFRYACNTCWCAENGQYFCTEMGCLKAKCGDHQAGDTWQDGAKTCTCAHAGVEEGWIIFKPQCK